MRLFRVLLACAVMVCSVASLPGAAGVQTGAQTIATIRQLETHWLLAEATGDGAFLEGFLMPDYRSVNIDGTVYGKARIIAGAMKPKSAATQYMMEHYSAIHHVDTSVVVHGDTAIVTFYSQRLGEDKGLSSSDILVNFDGQWRALYSAHTDLKM